MSAVRRLVYVCVSLCVYAYVSVNLNVLVVTRNERVMPHVSSDVNMTADVIALCMRNSREQALPPSGPTRSLLVAAPVYHKKSRNPFCYIGTRPEPSKNRWIFLRHCCHSPTTIVLPSEYILLQGQGYLSPTRLPVKKLSVQVKWRQPV